MIKNVSLINDLWTSTKECTRNNFDEDILLDTLSRVRTLKANQEISDFDASMLETYLLIDCSSRFYKMSDLDLFTAAVEAIDKQAAARKNKFDDLATYFDNIHHALYDIIINKGLSKRFDVYILSATIAQRKDCTR